MAEAQYCKIIEHDKLKKLMARFDAPALVHFGLHLLFIAAAAIALGFSEVVFAQAVFTLVLGISLTFLFAPLHETIHKTAFRSALLNRAVSRICGFIIFLPPRFFRSFHMAHHRFTQLDGKDPELDTPKPDSPGQYLFFLSGLQYWREQLQMFSSFVAAKDRVHFIRESRHGDVVREVRIYAFLYALLFAASLVSGSTVLLKYWLLPLIVGQPFLRMFLLAEHTLCPKVTDMLENTRTTLTNGLVRWLCWNMSFHVEHHAYPAIPFHQLPATHSIVAPHIRILGRGYLEVNREILGSFRQP